MGKRPKKTDSNKPWLKKAKPSQKKAETKLKGKTFLIFCQGENTEVVYFNSFTLNAEHKIKALGTGMSKTRLVEEAKRETIKLEKDKDRQVWVVFDKDISGKPGEDEDFNNAVTLAERQSINPAYSNDCFELWVLLHFQTNESALHRTAYYEKLSKHLAISYEREGKDKAFCNSLYDTLNNKQTKAIERARKLHNNHSDKTPANQNPCTTVYQLVEELNKYIKQ